MKTILISSLIGSVDFIKENYKDGVEICQFGLTPIYVSDTQMKYWFLPKKYNPEIASKMWLYGTFYESRIVPCDTLQDAINMLKSKGYEEVITQKRKSLGVNVSYFR